MTRSWIIFPSQWSDVVDVRCMMGGFEGFICFVFLHTNRLNLFITGKKNNQNIFFNIWREIS